MALTNDFKVKNGLTVIESISAGGNLSASEGFFDGDVGIGVTNPLGKLHVRSANAGSFTYDTNADDLIVESNANGGLTIATAAANTSRVIFASPDDATGGEISFNQTAKLMKIGPTTSNGLLALQSANGVETMRLDASNRVGIGTTSPSTKLTVSGSLSAHRFCASDSLGNQKWGASALNANTTGIHNTAIGTNTLYGNTVGQRNVAIGQSAMQCALSGCHNFATGQSALYSNYGGCYNSAIGYLALCSNTTGCYNTATGFCALKSNTTGSFNSAIGANALINNTTGSHNFAVGQSALFNNQTGGRNVGIGACTLHNNTEGNYNTALGCLAVRGNTTGDSNIGIGLKTLNTNQTGNYNTALGLCSQMTQDGGSHNFSVGYRSMRDATGGSHNVAFGSNALCLNTTGTYNTGIGPQSLASNKTGSDNVALGNQTLYLASSGNCNFTAGKQTLYNNWGGCHNSAIGYQALYSNTTGSNNVAVGKTAGCTITTGSFNTILGSSNGNSITTGSYNILLGTSITGSTLGSRNIYLGDSTGACGTTSSNNIGAGYRTLRYNTTGSGNVALGNNAGNTSSTGATLSASNCSVFIGFAPRSGDQDSTNEVVIGGSPTCGGGSNTTTIGNSSTTDTYICGDINAGNISTTGNILSAGVNIDQLFGTSGGGDITAVTTGPYLTGGGASGSVEVGIDSACAAAWDAAVAGDISAVVAGTGLTGGGTSGSVTLNISAGDGVQATANCVSVDSTVARTTGDTFTGNLKINDNNQLQLGTDADLVFYSDNTQTLMHNYNNNLIIKQDATDGDIIFQSDDGSGGTQIYTMLDGSEARLSTKVNNRFDDNARLELGTSGDLDLFHNGTDSIISNATGDLYIQNSADNKDIYFQSDNGSGGMATYFCLDGSAATANGCVYTNFPDHSHATFGSSHDFQIDHDGTNAVLYNQTGHLYISNDATDGDVVLRSDDGSGGIAEYLRLDGGNTNMVASKTMVFADAVKASFGNSEDLRIQHDGNDAYFDNYTGRIKIRQTVDDGIIDIQNDDGSGGLATYIQVNGSAGCTVAYCNFRFNDSVCANFGISNDLKIYHDGSNSYIADTSGTGSLIVDTNAFLLKSANNGEFMMTAYQDGAVNLFHNNATRLSTTASGITVCGNSLVTGDSTIYGNLSVTGDFTCLETTVSTTSALSVTNTGTGPALFVCQAGVQPIAHFIDANGDDIVFADDGKVGIGTFNPAEELTVSGTISASEFVYVGEKKAVSSDDINFIVKVTQAEYDALTPDSGTLYIITDENTNSPVINPITTVTANYTVTDEDHTILTNGSSVLNVGLPSAVTNSNYVYNVKNISTNAITISAAAGNIDGQSSQAICQQFENITVQSDGSNWFII